MSGEDQQGNGIVFAGIDPATDEVVIARTDEVGTITVNTLCCGINTEEATALARMRQHPELWAARPAASYAISEEELSALRYPQEMIRDRANRYRQALDSFAVHVSEERASATVVERIREHSKPGSGADSIIGDIDAALGCQQCGGALKDPWTMKDSVSDDFCSQYCQRDWHAARTTPIDHYSEPYDIYEDAYTSGQGGGAARARMHARVEIAYGPTSDSFSYPGTPDVSGSWAGDPLSGWNVVLDEHRPFVTDTQERERRYQNRSFLEWFAHGSRARSNLDAVQEQHLVVQAHGHWRTGSQFTSDPLAELIAGQQVARAMFPDESAGTGAACGSRKQVVFGEVVHHVGCHRGLHHWGQHISVTPEDDRMVSVVARWLNEREPGRPEPGSTYRNNPPLW